VVPLQHVLALRRRPAAVPAQGSSWPHPSAPSTRATTGIARNSRTSFGRTEDRPDLIEKCCRLSALWKRILLDNGWFRTLTRPDVELVTDPIDHLAREGIVAADGKLRLPISSSSRPASRSRKWLRGSISPARRQAPGRHLGRRQSDRLSRLTVPDFPILLHARPNTGPAHGGSVIFQSECQSRYITLVCRHDRARIAAIDVRKRSTTSMSASRSRARADDLDPSGMTTYYRNSRAGCFRDAMAIRDYWK